MTFKFNKKKLTDLGIYKECENEREEFKQNILAILNDTDDTIDETKNLTEIFNEIEKVIRRNTNDEELIVKILDKLVGYKYIDKVFQIKKGEYIRWIKLNSTPFKLSTGGTVANVKFYENGGTHILCRNANFFMTLKYDECIFFQKMSDDELLIMKAMEIIHYQK